MHRKLVAASVAASAVVFGMGASPARPDYDAVIRGGTVYDGSGGAPFVGDVAVKGDRIAYVGPHAPGRGAQEIDAKAGRAIRS